MYIDKPVKQKRSLEALRKANTTKPKSPDLTREMFESRGYDRSQYV